MCLSLVKRVSARYMMIVYWDNVRPFEDVCELKNEMTIKIVCRAHNNLFSSFFLLSVLCFLFVLANRNVKSWVKVLHSKSSASLSSQGECLAYLDIISGALLFYHWDKQIIIQVHVLLFQRCNYLINTYWYMNYYFLTMTLFILKTYFYKTIMKPPSTLFLPTAYMYMYSSVLASSVQTKILNTYGDGFHQEWAIEGS